jgi:HK97 family phage major capsid protein
MLRVPIRTRVALVTQGFVPGAVGEGSAKPLSKLSLNGISISETKVACQCVASLELLRNAALAARLLGDELRKAIAVQTDQSFLQKIGSGITPSTASGTTAAAILADMEVALDSMTFASNAKLYAVTTPLICKGIRTKADSTGKLAFPGALSGDPFGLTTLVASDGAAAGTMTIFDSTQLAADPGSVQFDVGNEATIQMDSVPDSPPTGSTTLVNLWQNNLSALRMERIFAVERPSTTAVAVIQSIAY